VAGAVLGLLFKGSPGADGDWPYDADEAASPKRNGL